MICTNIRELGPKIPYFRRNYGSQFPNGCTCGPSGRVVSTQLFMREALCMVMSLQCTRPELQNRSHMEGIRVGVVRALVLEKKQPECEEEQGRQLHFHLKYTAPTS